MSERSDRSELSTDKEELRGLFLFESLTDDQLDWLLDHGVVQAYDAGAVVYEQSDAAEFFYVLLDGEIQLEKVLDGTDVVLTSSDLPGSYAGATRAFIGASQDEAYASSLRVVTRSRLFRIRADDFSYALKSWFPMAVHLLDGLFLGLTNTEKLVNQREKLIALGALSAGLAHELNNPASAEVRAAETLSARLQDARRAIIKLAPELDKERLKELFGRFVEAVERARSPSTLSSRDAGDSEDALAER